MRRAALGIILNHPRRAFTLTTKRRWISCAHRPRAESLPVCAEETRDCPCASANRQLHAGGRWAVAKRRPRLGPKSVPPNGSSNSWWNRNAGHFGGSIGGFFFFIDAPWNCPTARRSVCSSLRNVSKSTDAHRALDAAALR